MRFASRRSPSQHQMPKNGLCTMGVPFSNANRIRFIEESTLSRWPSSPSGWDSPQGVPPPPPLYGEWDSLQGGPLLFLQGFHFSKWMRFTSRGFPLHSEWDSLQRIPLLNSEWDSHQVGHPLQENGIRTKRVTLSKANEIRTKGSPSPSEWDSHQEGHPLQSEWDSLLMSGLVAARDPFQGILLQGHATQGILFSKGLRLCV